ncbi:MAG TPA: hypothetical protein DD379_27745 [Cyanobacteria bacterium UBA11162]|nr:hypothetical protein [Cyanobacteria bacterium UBA11162]
MNLLNSAKLAVLGTVGLSAIGLLGVSQPADALSSDTFPKAGIDTIWHDLTVNIDIGDDGLVDETIVFDGRMKIERSNPFTNQEGYRQIDFLVKDWVASSHSNILQQDIRYILSKDVQQLPSQIISEQKDKDFPAAFFFNVIFDVQANNQLIFRHHHGRPIGHGFLVVPPDGNRVNSPTITSFEPTQIVIDQPGIGLIRFIPVECNDRKSETKPIPESSTILGSVLVLGFVALFKKRKLPNAS